MGRRQRARRFRWPGRDRPARLRQPGSAHGLGGGCRLHGAGRAADHGALRRLAQQPGSAGEADRLGRGDLRWTPHGWTRTRWMARGFQRQPGSAWQGPALGVDARGNAASVGGEDERAGRTDARARTSRPAGRSPPRRPDTYWLATMDEERGVTCLCAPSRSHRTEPVEGTQLTASFLLPPKRRVGRRLRARFARESGA
jgi:hypothetical protein